jgi:peptidoglycan/LPS O-acetylase OafA/YrhL
MGRIGVNLFFVISGLCIHLRLAKEQAVGVVEPFSTKTYFLRRFLRIYPAYWAALAIGVFVGPFVNATLASPDGTISGVQFPDWGNVLTHVFMLHSFFKDYMLSIIRTMWSIATEEQFYLLYPIVFVYLGRRLSIGKTVLLLLAIGTAWRAGFVLTNPPPRTFDDGPFLVWCWGFSIARYYEWSLGALLAWALANGKSLAMFSDPVSRFLGSRPRLVMAIGGGFILAGAASLASARLKWMIEDPCYSTGWFLILAAALLRPTTVTTTRGPEPRRGAALVIGWITTSLQALGRRSFSVYLMHELPLMAAVGLMRRYHLPVAVTVLLACILIPAVCLPFYRFVEAPFELRAKAIGKKAAAIALDGIRARARATTRA